MNVAQSMVTLLFPTWMHVPVLVMSCVSVHVLPLVFVHALQPVQLAHVTASTLTTPEMKGMADSRSIAANRTTSLFMNKILFCIYIRISVVSYEGRRGGIGVIIIKFMCGCSVMPINWLDWSSAAFAKAKSQKKPVLLAISAVWCHWCHTMDKETYAHPSVVHKLNTEFIPVRVDTDVRPDINDRYNLGGWPTTAILRADGSLVTGALYQPPEYLLDFLDQAKELARQPSIPSLAHPSPVLVDAKRALEQFAQNVAESFDPLYGGFGFVPKFPHPEVLLFLLDEYVVSKDKKIEQMLKKSLYAMLSGEFYDREGGGFFRYATQQNWTIPHFEKMVEDNALLLEVYSRAFAVFKEKKFAEVARETAGFLLTVLFDKKNCWFFGSQDADEAFCKLSREERVQAVAPSVDQRIYSGWNAQVFSGLMAASACLRDPLFETIAFKGLDSLVKKVVSPAGVAHAVIDGKLLKLFLAKDAVLLQSALLSGFQSSGRKEFLRSANALVSVIMKSFVDSGVVYDVVNDKRAVGLLRERRRDTNSMGYFSRNLLELSCLLKKKSYRATAQTIAACAAVDCISGISAAPVARALFLISQPLRVVRKKMQPRSLRDGNCGVYWQKNDQVNV